MNTLFITYSLDDYGETYNKIRARLKRYPNWAKLFARTWIIRTTHSSRRVRDTLSDVIEGKGHIVVVNITDSAWATYKVDESVLEWMKENV